MLYVDLIFCHVFEIKFIEMREAAVAAAYREMSAANGEIMDTGHMAVSTFSRFCQAPEVITAYLRECSRLCDIFNSWDKDTGRTAVITCNLRFIRDCFYYLVCRLSAMIAVRAEFCENEPFAHGKYWICPGSLICCTTAFPSHNICICYKSNGGRQDFCLFTGSHNRRHVSGWTSLLFMGSC